MENDGVQHVWKVYLGRPNEIAIALDRPMEACEEGWRVIAEGSWKEMWALFIAYLNLMNRGAE